MQNIRRIPFYQGVVITGIDAKGEYVAYREDAVLPRGHGYSQLSAIADLNRKIEALEGEDA